MLTQTPPHHHKNDNGGRNHSWICSVRQPRDEEAAANKKKIERVDVNFVERIK